MPEHLPRSADGHNIRVDGVPLHYRRGSAGPTVVPIHGASGNLRDWTFGAMAAMAERHDVIAFDRPGYWLSGGPASFRASCLDP